MTTIAPQRPASPTTLASRAFVAAHLEEAIALGRELGELANDPEAFLARLRQGLTALGDAEYEDGVRRVAPGIGPTLGVRNPLQAAMRRSLGRALRGLPPATVLFLADRLSREDVGEIRWLTAWLAGRVLPRDPERSWQLLRRFARDAREWITVDTLAAYYAEGILREAYRWAELEQLVFSPSPWERRLVGSTLAQLPFVDRRRGRDPLVATRSLGILADLIGDAEPDVQKSLSWALRSLTLVDRAAVVAFCEREARRAAETGDGHRAWVVRDALSKLPEEPATALRERLARIRRRPGAPSTSRAAETAGAFLHGSGLPAAVDLPEPPLA